MKKMIKFTAGLVLGGLCSGTVLASPPPILGGNGPQPRENGPQISLLKEYRPIGGVNNNLIHPNFNAVPGSPEIALAPLNFQPGTGHGLVGGPNPRLISTAISGGTSAEGQNSETDDPVASAWLYVFGQFVDHDLDLESSPSTSASITIIVPEGDPVFKAGTGIAMTRALRSPVTDTIINTTAGDLDLSQLYGSTAATAASLRNPDGSLASSDGGQALTVVGSAFVTGDPRVMENPELTALSTLFMREHNYWVELLKVGHPNWTGNQLYNMAKAITTAEYQNIIYEEYLPLLLGPVLGPYRGYDSKIKAQVTQEFSTAAFRMGHSQISGTQEGLDNEGNVVFTEALSEAFFNTAAEDEANGINNLLRSIGADYSQATDVYAVSVLRNLLFAPLPGGDIDQLDLIAIDIQRERDAGLGSLNQTRQAIGFKPYRSFAELTSDPVLQTNLEAVYTNINSVDLFMGGLAEDHAPGAILGPTFQAIIGGQFEALRAGDRFFWLNQGFDASTASMIASTKLSDILLRNTDIINLQPNVFIAASYPYPAHVKPHVEP